MSGTALTAKSIVIRRYDHTLASGAGIPRRHLVSGPCKPKCFNLSVGRIRQVGTVIGPLA